MVFFQFSRKSGDQGRPQAHIGNLLPDKGNDLFQFLPVGPASHPLQDRIGSMLDGHVQIMKDLRLFFDDSDQLRRNFLRIGIEDADPFNASDLCQPAQQVRQLFLSVEVDAVQGRFLGHQDQFTDAFAGQIFGLADQRLHGHAPEGAPYTGDDAVGTAFVAAFRDPQITVITAGRQDPSGIRSGHSVQGLQADLFPLGHLSQDLVQYGDQLFLSRCADHGVYLRDFFYDLLFVALSQAAGYDQGFELAGSPPVRHFQYGVDAFLLGVIDEAAGIDDHALRLFFIIRKGIAVGRQACQHFLGIHQILVTA